MSSSRADDVERRHILGDRRAHEPRLAGLVGEAVLQRGERGEVEVRIAPLQHTHRVEVVAFERLDQFRLERRAPPRGAEGTVTHMPSGAARDLAELGGIKLSEAEAVEFLSDAKAT